MDEKKPKKQGRELRDLAKEKAPDILDNVSFGDDMSDEFMSEMEEGATHDLDKELTDVEGNDEANDQAEVEKFFTQDDPDSEEVLDLDYLEQKSLVPDFAEYFFHEMETIPQFSDIERQMRQEDGEALSDTGDEVDGGEEEASEGEAEPLDEQPPQPTEPTPTSAPAPAPAEAPAEAPTEAPAEAPADATAPTAATPEGKTSDADNSGGEAPSEEAQEEVEEEESEVDFEELFALDRRLSAQAVVKKADFFEMDAFGALQTIIEFEPVDKRSQQMALAELEEQKLAKAKRQLENTIDQFLNELLHQVVLVSEQWAEDSRVRSKVDKRRLLRELPFKQSELEMDRKHLAFLERRTLDHFRKKKNMRVISNTLSPDFPQEEARFEEILMELDKALACEVETRRSARQAKARAEVELEAMQQEVTEQIKNLEETMRRIITREDRNELKQAVNRSLALFAHEREELRKLRAVIIRKQHVAATLLHKVEEIGTLGNGIMVTDFDRMQTKTLELGKKVEEREQDLYRMRLRYTSSLHIHAHLKERCAMVGNSLMHQILSYERMNNYKNSLKKELYSLKLHRLKIRKKTKDLSFQCGLLDKESLMHEYDATSDAVIERRKRNKLLRKQLKDLNTKIENRKLELSAELNV